MKAEDYFITLTDDISIVTGVDAVFCHCFCCDKFGYHAVIVVHKPTRLQSEVVTKIMELPLKCHQECSIATIEDPKDLAIKDLKRKIRFFCEEHEEMTDQVKDKNVPEMITCNLPGHLPGDVMRLHGKPLGAQTIADMDRIKKIGNDFHAVLEEFPKRREMALAKTKLEECIMWAVKGISSLGLTHPSFLAAFGRKSWTDVICFPLLWGSLIFN